MHMAKIYEVLLRSASDFKISEKIHLVIKKNVQENEKKLES